jgi:streptomycin 6-kinase
MPASSADRPTRPIRLQPLTRHRVAAMGADGAAWTAALPEVLAGLERDWSIVVDRALPGGSASFVARARRADGSATVVKVSVIDEGWADQVATLERADGRGYVRLLRSDLGRRAVLLEELGPSLAASGRPVPDQLRCLADTLALAWQDPAVLRAEPVEGRSTGSGHIEDKASGLAALIRQAWQRLDRPCSGRVVDQALLYAERRAAEADLDLVVVHGDPHPGNLLAVRRPRPGADTGYVFVDPDGFVADRAYDLGVVLRDWSSTLLGPDARAVAEGYCTVLAEHTGVDAQRIWEWGFIERVSTGLYVLDVVRAPDQVARPYLESAERLAD